MLNPALFAGRSAYDPAAVAYFDAIMSNGGVSPSPNFRRAVSDYIVDEKRDLNWGSQDWTYILATADSVTASINLAQPSLYKITWFGGVTFSVAQGVNGNTTDGYGDTNVNQNALVFATQNNAHYDVFTGAGGNNIFGGIGANGTYRLSLATDMSTRLSGTAVLTDTGGGGGGGHSANRFTAAPGVVTTYKNGAVLTSGGAAASAAPGAVKTAIGQNNGSFMTANVKIFFASVGAPLTDEAAHYRNARKMLVALGAQGI